MTGEMSRLRVCFAVNFRRALQIGNTGLMKGYKKGAQAATQRNQAYSTRGTARRESMLNEALAVHDIDGMERGFTAAWCALGA